MASFLPAFQAGAAVASNRLAREQRDAEFRAQAAMRQLAERQLAQRIELEKQNADQAIQMRADAEKAAAAMTLDLAQSDIIAMPQDDQGPPQANPNKLSASQAYLKNFGPFFMQHQPQNLPAFLATTARLEESEARRNFQPRGMIEPVTKAPMVETSPGDFRAFPPPEPEGTRQFAPPEVARLIQLRDAAQSQGNKADASIYSQAIEAITGRQQATARSRAHTELSTTIRQQMRAIDDSNAKPADKEAQKAVLMQQLEASRRTLLGDLEGEAPSPTEQALSEELTKLDKAIADIEVDLAKNPKQGRFDMRKDNRQVKLEELRAQRAGVLKKLGAGQPAQVAPAAQATPVEQQAPAVDPTYPTPESVRNAVRTGTLTRELAIRILREKFGMTE